MLQLHISLNVVLSADLVKKNTVLSFISHSISPPPPPIFKECARSANMKWNTSSTLKQ